MGQYEILEKHALEFEEIDEVEEYEVEEEVLRKDYAEFIDRLIENGLAEL